MVTLADRLVQCGAVRFGEFPLTRGASSPYYVDVKAASTDPATLRAVAAQMARFAADGPFDAVASMELGAVPLASVDELQSTPQAQEALA